MIQKINQRLWPGYLGKTKFTIARWGCLTCVITAMRAFLDKKEGNPTQMAQTLKYNAQGNLLWDSLSKVGLKLVRRIDFCDTVAINNALKHPSQMVALQVEDYHFVWALGRNWSGGWRIMDPLHGDISTTKRYKFVSGVRIIDKI